MFWRDQQRVVHWLTLVALLLFMELVLGGMTRHLGFAPASTPLDPAMGWLPPLSEEAWRNLFQQTQSHPRFRNINWGLDLEGFRSMYLLEYGHRLTGRLSALFFLLPWIWHLLRGHLHLSLAMRLGGLALLTVGLESMGLLPWSDALAGPYWNAFYAALSLLIYASVVRTLLKVRHLEGRRPSGRDMRVPRQWAGIFLFVLFLSMLSGNLTAASGGGMVFNTFPLMNNRWVPVDGLLLSPELRNILENVATLQWEHRFLALIAWVVLVMWVVRVWQIGVLGGLLWALVGLAGLLLVQSILGVSSLLMIAPPPLAFSHQLAGMLLFTMAVWVHQRLR